MFGVFADSLPRWGKLLLDRALTSKGIDISNLTMLDEYILGGSSGGARPKILVGYNPKTQHIIIT